MAIFLAGRAGLGCGVAGRRRAGRLVLDWANILLSPEDKGEFVEDGVFLVLIGAGIFMIVTAVIELIASVAWRLGKWWLRPWFDIVLGAVLCYGLVHAPGVNISFSGDGADGASVEKFVALGLEALPPIAGALAALVYWIIAAPKRA
ncbi:MAG: hypothetical protein QM759_18040 [Terricaulis sp.]